MRIAPVNIYRNYNNTPFRAQEVKPAEDAESIARSHQMDIESLLEKKVTGSEITKYSRDGKPHIEMIALEDGTVLKKTTMYNNSKGGKVDFFVLKYQTNIPEDFPYLRFEYMARELDTIPAGLGDVCWVRYLNKNAGQGHGQYLPTKLR